MTSLAPMPAFAGDPGATRSMSAPGTSLSSGPPSPTPRKAVGPTCTVDELRPASICPAIFSARLIGIAYPCRCRGYGRPTPRRRADHSSIAQQGATGVPGSQWRRRLDQSGQRERRAVVAADRDRLPEAVTRRSSWSPLPLPLPTATTRSPTRTVLELPVCTSARALASRSSAARCPSTRCSR